ncbi:cation/H+ exchanger 9 [Euphorbia peplus]|nr:cation/H+ exchanger 9 [Euphorbia peplus]
MTCLVLPPKSNSHGVLAGSSLIKSKHVLNYSMPLIELQFGIILTLSHLLCFFLKRFGISTFVSCMLAGIILGPNGLGQFDTMRQNIFPYHSQEIIYEAVNLGFSVYIFLAGVQMELGMLLKSSRKALTIGITTAAVPFIAYTIYNHVHKSTERTTLEEFRLAAAGAVTSLPVVANVVDQLKLANTELGRLALTSGLVSDIGCSVIFVIRVVQRKKSWNFMITLIALLIFLLLLAFIFRPIVDMMIRNTPEGKPLSTSLICVIVAFAIVSQVYFHVLKLNFTVAPFLVGLAVPAGAPLGSALVEKFGTFATAVVMHILIPVALIKADLHLFISSFPKIARSLVILFVSVLLKMTSSLLPCMVLKIPLNQAAALAFILSYTGVIHLNMGAFYRDDGSIREEIYGVIVFYILLNASIFPIIIKRLYNPTSKHDSRRARNVLNLKPHSELKILACIHGQDNADSCIKLLDKMHPTKESPVSICGLHLVELVGQYVPLLVSHSKIKPVSSTTSQKMVYDFKEYEKNNWNAVSIQLFTSLSSFPLMHEDVINIAHEKKTSLIILPLHRRWSVHGYLESQEITWRNVNRSVLEKAPCSVAIFFSRGSHPKQRSRRVSNLSICMVFFGGGDDREALIIAKRMLKESQVTLTIVHYLPTDYDEVDESEDHMYDAVVLEDIKQMAMINYRIDYRPYIVLDGAETILKIRSMANEFDMFVVGRRYGVSTPQLSGLSEWSELPELGIIGDLFASKDLATRASVLVVQQKEKKLGIKAIS